MPDVGKGVRELRIRTKDGAYRVFCVEESASAVDVLHAFQKKTQRTSRQGLDKGKARANRSVARICQHSRGIGRGVVGGFLLSGDKRPLNGQFLSGRNGQPKA